MENSDIFLNLFYDTHKNSFKIKTDLKKDKVDEILFECYRATLNQSPDYRAPKMHDVYNILIKLDLFQDIFSISSNTGNKVLAYELIKEAINNWESISEEIRLDKSDLEEIILRNKN